MFNYIAKTNNLLMEDLKEAWFGLEEVLLFLEVSINKTILLLRQVVIIDQFYIRKIGVVRMIFN
jgi:hypothetical protein